VRFLAAALQRDVHVTTTDRIFKLAGRTYPRGTLIIEVKKNPADVARTVEGLAKSTGADVFTTDTGWVDEGANFGSHHVFAVPQELEEFHAFTQARPSSIISQRNGSYGAKSNSRSL